MKKEKNILFKIGFNNKFFEKTKYDDIKVIRLTTFYLLVNHQMPLDNIVKYINDILDFKLSRKDIQEKYKQALKELDIMTTKSELNKTQMADIMHHRILEFEEDFIKEKTSFKYLKAIGNLYPKIYLLLYNRSHKINFLKFNHIDYTPLKKLSTYLTKA